MHADVNLRRRGSADLFSLTILGFLVASFVVGTIAVVSNQSFDIRQRAQTYSTRYSCQSGSCAADPNGEFLSLGECGSSCPAPQPLPSYDCRDDFEGMCVPSNYTCDPGTTITQASGCSSGQKCVPRSSTCYLPIDTPTVCPTSCLNGCILTENNTKECIPYCTAQLNASCQYGCDPSISGGVCKPATSCPTDRCPNGCVGGSTVCNAYCAISCPAGQECLATSEGGICRAASDTQEAIPDSNLPLLESCSQSVWCDNEAGCSCMPECNRQFTHRGNDCGGTKIDTACSTDGGLFTADKLINFDNSKSCQFGGQTQYWCVYSHEKLENNKVRCLSSSEYQRYILNECPANAVGQSQLVNKENAHGCRRYKGEELLWYCPSGSESVGDKLKCLGAGEVPECRKRPFDAVTVDEMLNPNEVSVCIQENGEELVECQYGFIPVGDKLRCIDFGEVWYRKDGASCRPCRESAICEFATVAECLASTDGKVQGDCIQTHCTTSGNTCSNYGFASNNNSCPNNGQCCTKGEQGYNFIDGACVTCNENCQFQSQQQCQDTADLRKQPVSGDSCELHGDDGAFYYFKPGQPYHQTIYSSALGYICVEKICGNDAQTKYCDQKSVLVSDPVYEQVNPAESELMKTEAADLVEQYTQYGVQFEYLDVPGFNPLAVTDQVLSALPENVYKNRKIVYYDSNRSNFSRSFVNRNDRNTMYIEVRCTGNQNCSISAEDVIHEFSHTHEHEEYVSSHCESGTSCSLLEAYNVARKQDEICVGNELDDAKNDCAPNSFAYRDQENFQTIDNPQGHPPDYEQLANATAAYCTDPETLKREQPTVYQALKDTIYEGNDCNL